MRPFVVYVRKRTESAEMIFTGNESRMIHLKHTTGLQEVMIPRTGLEYSGPAVLELAATFNGEPLCECGFIINAAEPYHKGRIALAEGLAGEYHYILRQNGIRVAAGLAIIGEPSRIPEAAAGSVENISIKQYGEN